MYKIIENFERPDSELVKRAMGLYFCIVGGRVGPRYVMDPGIKPLERSWKICGPALTVRPEQSDDLLMSQLASKYVKPGDVIVIDAAGQKKAACLGATMVSGFKEMGGAGIVADGYVLTGEVIRKREGIPLFCRGTVSVSRGMEKPGWINVPVICGGVIICPGDLILGDEDGVVVVPKEYAETVISEVEGYVDGRESANRPLDGKIPSRVYKSIPYYKRSGAEDKVKKMKEIKVI